MRCAYYTLRDLQAALLPQIASPEIPYNHCLSPAGPAACRFIRNNNKARMSAIQIDQVMKRYGTLQALGGVTFSIEEGEFFGLLGPNGAGKTTLISILAGLNRADSGSVKVMGHDVVKDYRKARSVLGVVPQELVFDPFFTVRETLRMQSGYFGLPKNDAWIDEVMHHLDLTSKADANTRSLSGGMKRRVLVAQALVHKPPVIVLDEPTAGVDVELRQTLWKFIARLNREGHTVVLTTHYLEEAQALCNRIAMLRGGKRDIDPGPRDVREFASSQVRAHVAGDGDRHRETRKMRARRGKQNHA